MANPQKALKAIAEAGAKAATENSGEDAASGVADRSKWGAGDPFDPRTWQSTAIIQPPAVSPAPPPVEGAPARQPGTSMPAANRADDKEVSTAQGKMEMSSTEPSSLPLKTHDAEQRPTVVALQDSANAAGHGKAKTAEGDAAVEARDIADAIARETGTGLDRLPESIAVDRTDDGILISLTDRENFGMFKSGSSEPEPQLVRLVEAIARVLAAKPGYIVVRGHTDARPYRNRTYDNWQLSTARAHFAQYMLIRGGLSEKRIRRIEGMADRDPRNTSDPQAPENRRIEILLGLEKQ